MLLINDVYFKLKSKQIKLLKYIKNINIKSTNFMKNISLFHTIFLNLINPNFT